MCEWCNQVLGGINAEESSQGCVVALCAPHGEGKARPRSLVWNLAMDAARPPCVVSSRGRVRCLESSSGCGEACPHAMQLRQ